LLAANSVAKIRVYAWLTATEWGAWCAKLRTVSAGIVVQEEELFARQTQIVVAAETVGITVLSFTKGSEEQ